MRNLKLDNIKGILILLVVFGHLLELVLKNPIARAIYICIYMFHMPVFIFTTGYFAKFNFKKLCKNLLYPFIVFSFFYQLCGIFFWKDIKTLQLIKPYWLLWYLVATMAWTISMPLWQNRTKLLKKIFIVITFIVSLVSGYFDGIGREFSLSRILVFFPFFVLGSYWKQEATGIVSFYKKYHTVLQAIFSVCGIFLFGGLYLKSGSMKYTWLYEATSYGTSQYTFAFRLLHLLVGLFMVCFLMLVIPNIKFKKISRWGENTMPVFLLHGFLIKTLSVYGSTITAYFMDKKMIAALACLLAAIMIVVCLSTDFIKRIISPFLYYAFGGKK